ncbi:MAG: Uma2 family endonuclease [Planctomycetes bacterium]|nr:Uma2 family endonuclease [Planctomycetota bacterium]
MATVIERSQELDLGRAKREPLALRPGRRYFADHPLTVEEFYALIGEGSHAELVDGAILVPSPTSYEHEDLCTWLVSICRSYAEERRLGSVVGGHTSVRLDEYNTRIPDILFVAKRRRAIIKRLDVQGPPDWVVEIVASDSGRREAVAKQPQYERLGVPEIWRIDIVRHKLTIIRRTSTGEYQTCFQGASGEFAPDALPGLELKVKWFRMTEDRRPSVHRVVSRLLEKAARELDDD